MMVKDFWRLSVVKRHIELANSTCDGPGEFGYVLDPGRTMPVLELVPWGIAIPGDGKEFPSNSVAKALWVSEVVIVRG